MRILTACVKVATLVATRFPALLHYRNSRWLVWVLGCGLAWKWPGKWCQGWDNCQGDDGGRDIGRLAASCASEWREQAVVLGLYAMRSSIEAHGRNRFRQLMQIALRPWSAAHLLFQRVLFFAGVEWAFRGCSFQTRSGHGASVLHLHLQLSRLLAHFLNIVLAHHLRAGL